MPTLQLRKASASGVDPVSFQVVLADRVRRLRSSAFVLIGIVVFMVALIATLPAAAVLSLAGAKGTNAVGTAWKGEAAIGPSSVVSWQLRPLRSLLRIGLAVDIEVHGGATQMTGTGLWWPGHLRVDDLSGLAGPGLVNTLIADLPIQCDLSFAVDFDTLVLAGRHSGAQGSLRSGPGRCAARNGVDAPPSTIPAMVGRSVMTANGTSAWLAPASNAQGGQLAQMTIDQNGKLTATILDAGALILPATAGRMAIETQL